MTDESAQRVLNQHLLKRIRELEARQQKLEDCQTNVESKSNTCLDSGKTFPIYNGYITIYHDGSAILESSMTSITMSKDFLDKLQKILEER